MKRDRKWTENLQETENLEMGKMEVVASGGLVRLTPGKGAGPPLSESSLLSFEHHPPLTRSLDLFHFPHKSRRKKPVCGNVVEQREIILAIFPLSAPGGSLSLAVTAPADN